MTINEKILQFVDYLGFSQRKFTNKCGLSEGALRGSRSIGIESLLKIKENYPYLNLDWLFWNKGEMILPESSTYGVNEPDPIWKSKKVSIDTIIDQKIDTRFRALKETLELLVQQELNREIKAAKKAVKKSSNNG